MRPALLIAALLISVAADMSAAARPFALQERDQERARGERSEGNILSYAEIVQAAQHAVPGKVVDQELRRAGGNRQVYRLKIMQEGGKIARVTLDARTGAILDVKGKL